MFKYSNNSIFKHLLILCLSLALLLAQTSRLHMYLQHDGHPSLASGHVVNAHTASILHDIDLISHHDNHHSTAIDISSANIVKKTTSLNPLAILLLFVTFLLFISYRAYVPRQRFYHFIITPVYYLLYPPLRAPPFIPSV